MTSLKSEYNEEYIEEEEDLKIRKKLLKVLGIIILKVLGIINILIGIGIIYFSYMLLFSKNGSFLSVMNICLGIVNIIAGLICYGVK